MSEGEVSIFETDNLVRDPKQERYEGDLKAELVEAIYTNAHVLGTPSYRVEIGQWGQPVLRVQLNPLDLSKDDIVSIVDRKVTQLIGELLEFDHVYNSEFNVKDPSGSEGATSEGSHSGPAPLAEG